MTGMIIKTINQPTSIFGRSLVVSQSFDLYIRSCITKFGQMLVHDKFRTNRHMNRLICFWHKNMSVLPFILLGTYKGLILLKPNGMIQNNVWTHILDETNKQTKNVWYISAFFIIYFNDISSQEINSSHLTLLSTNTLNKKIKVVLM